MSLAPKMKAQTGKKRASDTATKKGSDNDNERKKERQEDSLKDFKAIVVTVESEGTTCLDAA